MLFKYAMCIVHDGTMERGGTGMPEQNNKLKLVRAVMLCVTLAIMAAIFLFSAQPGESSSALSQQITEKVESTAAHRLTPKWFSSQNDNANIRKWAHVYIYCALGVSTAVTVHEVTLTATPPPADLRNVYLYDGTTTRRGVMCHYDGNTVRTVNP